MTDPEVRACLRDFEAVYLTIWAEARSEPLEGQVAVGSVIRNRLQSGRFGKTYAAVCLAPLQFSCWNEGTDPNHVALMDMARSIVGDYAERTTVPDSPTLRQIKFITQGILGGELMDVSRGSTHYLTQALFRLNPPTWAKGQPLRATIGSQVYLRVA